MKKLLFILMIPSLIFAYNSIEKEYMPEEIIYIEGDITNNSIITDMMGRPITGFVKTYSGEKLYTISKFKNGQLSGTMEVYYPEGSVQYEIPYVMNVINGILKEYYRNGKTKSEFPYVNGIVNGVYKEFDTTGRLFREVNFISGNMSGPEKRYTQNGEQYIEIDYKNDTAVKGYCIKGRRKSMLTAKQLEEWNSGDDSLCK